MDKMLSAWWYGGAATSPAVDCGYLHTAKIAQGTVLRLPDFLQLLIPFWPSSLLPPNP